LRGARDVTVRRPVVICPLDSHTCQETMEAIEQAALDASLINPANPMLPARRIVLAHDKNSLRTLGLCVVGGQKKLLIE